jgi:hypothetical protein
LRRQTAARGRASNAVVRFAVVSLVLVACGHAAPPASMPRAQSLDCASPTDCGVSADPDVAATCRAGRCEPLHLASLPQAGPAGGCTITHVSSMFWASDMLVVSPPETDEHGITHTAALVQTRITCPAYGPTVSFRVAGWITAEGATHATDAVRGQRDDGTPWDFEVGPGATLDLQIVAEGPFLPQGAEIRVVLHWAASDGTSVDLGAAPGTLMIAS